MVLCQYDVSVTCATAMKEQRKRSSGHTVDFQVKKKMVEFEAAYHQHQTLVVLETTTFGGVLVAAQPVSQTL